MANVTVAQIAKIEGGSDNLAMNLKVFAGEVITAFERGTVALNRHIIRTIDSGKSAQFPVFGRASVAYLKPGENLDDKRTNIKHNEKIITIDGLLTSDQLITDIEEAMAHYEVRGEYAKQMGEALALSADGAVLAELAKLVVADQENITGLGKGGIVTRTVGAGLSQTVNAELGGKIVEMLLDMKTKFDKLYVPATERTAYVTPEAHTSMIANLVVLNRDYGATATITEANVLRVAGFDVIAVPHLTMGGADAGVGGANLLQGLGHAFPEAYKDKVAILASHRTAVGTVKLRDLAIENARRANYQANQIICKYAMGHGGLRPEAVMMGTITEG